MLNLHVKNIEFKARCWDLQEIRGRLAEEGIALDRRMRQVDTYFNVSEGRLKLREIDLGESQLVQYFRPDESAARQSDYIVVPVERPEELKQALTRALGVSVVVEKVRELYLWEHTRVHLDAVKGLGTFLELETVIREQTVESARGECQRIQKALKINPDDLLSGSYADLLRS
jgi:predicted adenylyl cyclase CyaB